MTTAMLLFGVLTVIAACGVVFSRKPLNSALNLIVTLFLVAVHFALLNADFIAVIQVLVYAGAIMVLVVFVIMLLGIGELVSPRGERMSRALAALGTGIFVALLSAAVWNRGVVTQFVSGSETQLDATAQLGSAEAVGSALFTKYVYPFEIASVLLLAAIVGAVVLAHEPKRPLPVGRGLRAMHTPDEDTSRTG